MEVDIWSKVIPGLFGLGGVIVGSTLTFVKDAWFNHKTKVQDQTYLAIKVSYLLESFLTECSNVVQDKGLEDKDGCLRPSHYVPDIDFSDLDINWKALPSKLMHDLLSFPVQIENADAYIAATSEYVACPPFYEEYFEERTKQYAKLGQRAHQLAQELRDLANLPQPDFDDEPDYRLKSFTEAIKRFDEIQSKRHQSQQRLFDTSVGQADIS